MPPRRTRPRTSAILGSPANGANVTGPPDGIMDVGTAFFVPEAWRKGNQFSGRADYELRPGRDRLYGNLYRTTSYTMNNGIRPAFTVPVLETTHFGNVNYTHTFSANKLNEFRGGFMRLVGEPQTQLQPLEVPGITITGATGFGTASYPRGWWQTNWHFKNIFTWSRSSHLLKTGAELRQMYGSAVNTTAYIPAYNFASILNFANDQALQMTRYVDPRTGEPVTAYSELTQTEWADLHQRRLEGHPQPHDQRRRAVRELRDLQGQRRHASQHRVRPGLDVRGEAGLRARRLRRPVLPDRQQQHRSAARVCVGPDGRRQDVGARRLRDRVRPPHEPSRGELPAQPAAARVGAARPVLRHAVHLQPRRSVQAVSRLPGRSGAAGWSRPAQRRHRRARGPDHRRSGSEEPLCPQLVRGRAA